MYSLVKFTDDNILHITSSKALTQIDGSLVWAPYRGMGFYEAVVLAKNNRRWILNKLMRDKSISESQLEEEVSSNTENRPNSKYEEADPYTTDVVEENLVNEVDDEANLYLSGSEGSHKPSSDCGNIDIEEENSIDNEANLLSGSEGSHQRSSDCGNIDIEEENSIDYVEKRIWKKHSCMYCGVLQSNLPRHLERKHNSEKSVQEGLNLPKGSQLRKKAFEHIRKLGDLKYNTAGKGNLISVGRSSKPDDTTFIPCPNCKGYYSKKNLKNHVRLKCKRQKDLNKRNILGSSRVIAASIHPNACSELKADIFPTMRDDEIFKIATTDSTIVYYGNMLIDKYYKTNKHNYKMIAQHLRHIAKLFITVKKIESSLNEVKEMFDPTQYDNVVKAIHLLAGLNEGRYRAPSVASLSCTLLSHLVHFIKCQAIKDDDKQLEEKVEKFAYLLQHSQNADITKVVTETRTQQQRRKQEILPTTEQVKSLLLLLEEENDKCYNSLYSTYNFQTWCKLSEVVLTFIMVFNRKRPGDIEKSELIEYQTLATVDADYVKKLTQDQQVHAQQLSRFTARGKLNKSASILLTKKHIASLDLLLKYRVKAGVSHENKFLFANPRGKLNMFFKADEALKRFCKNHNMQCGMFNATKLRKHLATSTSTLPQNQQHIISDFMGHGIGIHNNIYKQRQVQTDIVTMGQVLMEAGGLSSDNSKVQPGTEAQTCKEMPPIFSTNNENDNCQYSSLSSDISHVADLSVIQEENESDTSWSPSMDCSTPKRRIRIAPSRRNLKRSWSTPERQTLRNVFQDYFKTGTVPDFKKCQDTLLSISPCTIRRSVTQVRSWIKAEHKRIQRDGTNRKGWTTPQKLKCREHFKDYYLSGKPNKYPSMNEILTAIRDIPELRSKSAESLKSHLQHDYKYVSERSSL